MENYISIFGSYKPNQGDEEYETAYDISFKLAKKGYTIINGGGSGIMEASSKGAVDGGGKALGVIIGNLYTSNEFQKKEDTIVSKNLFDRLEKLIIKSSAFILFPGGTGTLAELAMVWELENKKLIQKAPIICYSDYWRPVIESLTKKPIYIKETAADLIHYAYSGEEILDFFK